MDQKRKGILTVLSGFSGSGKGTVMQELLQRHGERYALSISATTRAPRGQEEDGREYFFKTREEFQKMIANHELIEYALYVENYYGTPKAYVEERLEAGKDVILEIEIQGARKVKEMYPDALLIFVTPKDAGTLKERLLGRGTESEEAALARLSRASWETEGMEDYDYLVVNDVLLDCVENVHSIIQNEHKKMFRNQEFIDRIKGELMAFRKENEA